MTVFGLSPFQVEPSVGPVIKVFTLRRHLGELCGLILACRLEAGVAPAEDK